MQSPEFDGQALADIEARLDSLNHALERLNASLEAAESDDKLEQQLLLVNRDIATLRQQWRALLSLPPPRE